MYNVSLKIYVALYKRDKFINKLRDHHYIPILCGKKIFKDTLPRDGFLPLLGDDTGDNISEKNHPYSELTGLYWIWKNDKSNPDDIVGLNHYRRYFAEPVIKLDDENELLSANTIIKLLDEFDFITNGPSIENYDDFIIYDPNSDPNSYGKNSAYENYKECHIIEDLDNALLCIKKFFPDLYDTINYQVRYSGAMNLCNLVITKKKYLDDYCNFLFTVFKELESYIDFTEDAHQGYNGRVFGFLAERLFRAWLVARRYTAIQGRGLDWEKYSGYIWE